MHQNRDPVPSLKFFFPFVLVKEQNRRASTFRRRCNGYNIDQSQDRTEQNFKTASVTFANHLRTMHAPIALAFPILVNDDIRVVRAKHGCIPRSIREWRYVVSRSACIAVARALSTHLISSLRALSFRHLFFLSSILPSLPPSLVSPNLMPLQSARQR